jgi:PAS domain S-box-containing protein
MLKNLPLRYKMLASYSTLFVVSFLISSVLVYSLVRRNTMAGIEDALLNSNKALLNMVRTSAAVSIKNHLRAVAEKNVEIVRHYHAAYLRGALSESEAKQKAGEVLLSQRIGESGYLYCLDSLGTVTVHPEGALVGANVADFAFVKEQMTRKRGYVEYDWKNPGETRMRPKALYMDYFPPWDWIVSASTYRNEFNKLIDVEDFTESVLALRFGQTGYAYVFDTNGDLLIHPILGRINILASTVYPNQHVKDMLAMKSGKLIYEWQNPGDRRMRKKLAIFHFIPEYQWVVASSSYLDEVYGPLNTVRNIMVMAVLATLALVLPLSFKVSATITRPLKQLTRCFDTVVAGDFTPRLPVTSDDEIGLLAREFNGYMAQLQSYSDDLKEQISVRQETERALRESEARYRSVMAAAPDPVIVYDMVGRVTFLNRSFTAVFGWTLDECLGKRMDHFVPDSNWAETQVMINMALAGERISGTETRRYTRNGDIIDVSISGASYRDHNGELAGCIIILRDITAARRLEKLVMDIGDRERQKIGQILHDDLCPQLIGIGGLGTALGNTLEAKNSSEAALAGRIVAHIEDAIQKARLLARGLCPVHLVAHGLQTALEDLANNVSQTSGIDCRLDLDSDVVFHDNALATQLYYIAQEAVNNAVRHAGAKRIAIAMKSKGPDVMIAVVDDGSGISPERPSRGIGLQIMRYRAKMIGAAISIDRAGEAGTRVAVTLGRPGFLNEERTRHAS